MFSHRFDRIISIRIWILRHHRVQFPRLIHTACMLSFVYLLEKFFIYSGPKRLTERPTDRPNERLEVLRRSRQPHTRPCQCALVSVIFIGFARKRKHSTNRDSRRWRCTAVRTWSLIEKFHRFLLRRERCSPRRCDRCALQARRDRWSAVGFAESGKCESCVMRKLPEEIK